MVRLTDEMQVFKIYRWIGNSAPIPKQFNIQNQAKNDQVMGPQRRLTFEKKTFSNLNFPAHMYLWF